MKNEDTLSKLVAVIATITMGLAGWTLDRVHALAIDQAALRQIVIDGKESRLSAALANEASHRRIEQAIQELVTRSEFENRMKPIEAYIAKQNGVKP